MPAELNAHVLTVANSQPRGGGYSWDPTGKSGGVLDDVVHRGVTIARTGRGTYCSGITFDIWWHALGLAGVELDLRVEQMRALQRRWYCAAGGRRGPLDALETLGLGVAVTDPRPGDFAQLWRRDGSGHTVVVLGYRDGLLHYLSSQTSTRGIGERVERPTDLFVVRALVPLPAAALVNKLSCVKVIRLVP